MNDEVITDLKQFISAKFSEHMVVTDERFEKMDQSFGKIDGRFEAIDVRLDRIEVKLDDLSTSVAEAMSQTNDDNDARFTDHEHRIVTLEQKAS